MGLIKPQKHPHASIIAWRKLTTVTLQGLNQHPIRYTLRVLELLTPCNSLKQWEEEGILWMDQVFYDNLPRPLEYLLTELNLSKSALFTYTRTSTLISKYPPSQMKLPNHVWNFLSSSSPKHKGISLFYNKTKQFLLRHPLCMLKWEEDLHLSFSETQWTTAICCN